MPHSFENFAHSHWKNGKPIFSPSAKGREWGDRVKRRVSKRVKFDPFVYHFKDGSHIKALHSHRNNTFFCRVDLARFFYSIKRNRIKRVLKEIGIRQAEEFAKWSTVKNPYEGEGYVLPYGFIQSPILATVVLMASPVGSFLRALDPDAITVSVYMDDICLSSNKEAALWTAFDGLQEAVSLAGFSLNTDKTRTPANSIDIFNCNLEQGHSEVQTGRIAEFYSVPRSAPSVEGFETYVDIVKSHTWRATRKRKRQQYVQGMSKVGAKKTQNAPSGGATTI